MERREQLKECLKEYENIDLVEPVIDEVVFIENKLKALRELPFISYSKANPSLQKPSAAAKMYKEFMQSYLNAMKILIKCAAGTEGESLLVQMLSEFKE